MIVFATSGKPDSFGKRKYPQELPAYLAEFGLNGYEFSCGRGVNISEETYDFFEMSQTHVLRSFHTPYFISISSVEEATRQKSVSYILEAAIAAKRLGAERIVVHSGSCAKLSRETAFSYALETLKQARALLDEKGLRDITICPETMGKINQLGTLDEVLELCKFDERMLPCIDFGHLNARTHGGIKTQADYAEIFDKVADKLGNERLHNLHIHFSRIEYSAGGEKKHLTFADGAEKGFGPEYEPFLEEIARRNLEPFIVCESDGTQAEDCSQMARYYKTLQQV